MTTHIPQHRPKVLAFAVDHTLTPTNTWYELTRALGGNEEIHFQLYQKFLKDEISHEEMSNGIVQMLEKGFGKKIHKNDLKDIFFQIPLRGEAFSVISELRDKGYNIVLNSSSIDVFVEQVAERLQIPHWFANSKFEFDEEGYWRHFVYRKDESKYKLEQLSKFLTEQATSNQEVLVIGEDEGDIDLFEEFPSVAVDSKIKEIRNIAWKEIKYLPTLLQILEGLE